MPPLLHLLAISYIILVEFVNKSVDLQIPINT